MAKTGSMWCIQCHTTVTVNIKEMAMGVVVTHLIAEERVREGLEA